jgi:hypothetical protein
MTPHETLLKNEDTIKLVIEHGYLPQKSSGPFGEILCALREIDKDAKYDPGCSGCISEIVKMANIHLQNYKKSNIMTFPKHT